MPKPAKSLQTLTFSQLPAYARFIRENHLQEYVAHQLKGARKLDVPLLKIFGDMADELIIQAAMPGHIEFLVAAEENKLGQLLEESMRKWINDQLEMVGRDEIEARDITQVSYLRKTALVHFLPIYTPDVNIALEIVKEIDAYQMESDTIATNTYIEILQDRIAAQTKALIHSEEQLLEAQKIAALGSFDWDLITGNVSASPQLLKVLDIDSILDLETFIHKVHPADKQKVKDAIELAYKTGVYECEYRLEARTGNERIIWSRGYVLIENERPVNFTGTVMDVTEKHHMVRQLQRSEELYKQAQALSHIGNWALDILHNRLTWSDELYRIYGLEIGTEISYELVYSYNHPGDAEMVTESMQQAISDHKPFEFYYRIRSKDGKEKILHANGEVLVDEGKAFKLIGTLQDVTKQQIAEQQLRSSREFIQKIANTTPSLIASYNVNTGKYTFINQSLQTILGYSPQEALNKGVEFFASIVHPEDIGPVMEKNAKALEQANSHPPQDGNEMVVEFKYRMKDNNGQYHWFQTFGTIFDRNAEGRVEHVLNVSIDITSQEIAERELQQKNIELQQSNTSLEEYAYVASHDLKEPLRKIATFSDRLITTQFDLLTEDGKTYLNKIIESSKRMQNMISDLLTVSVISGNRVFEQASLQAIFEDVKQTLEYKMEEKHAVVTADNLPVARVVPSQFRQLFQNLISNSLKFAREGVTPEVKMCYSYVKPADVQQYNLTKASRYLKLDIVDNGIGFDNQYVNKIFTIFQRLHSRTEYEGTGIGLAICKKIAENHGGTITANGQINEGATFSIIIPA